MRWGVGFMLGSDTLPLSPSGRAFGHGGWGGSLGIADPDARVGWGYAMNRMSAGTVITMWAPGFIAPTSRPSSPESSSPCSSTAASAQPPTPSG